MVAVVSPWPHYSTPPIAGTTKSSMTNPAAAGAGRAAGFRRHRCASDSAQALSTPARPQRQTCKPRVIASHQIIHIQAHTSLSMNPARLNARPIDRVNLLPIKSSTLCSFRCGLRRSGRRFQANRIIALQALLLPKHRFSLPNPAPRRIARPRAPTSHQTIRA